MSSVSSGSSGSGASLSSGVVRPFPPRAGGELAPGSVVAGKYRIERVLGEGGMGVVLAATDLQLDRKVAIKALSPTLAGSRRAARRFLREARSASALPGEHIVRIFEVGELANGTPYIVMELLVGRDLEDVVLDRGRLSPREAVDLLLQAIEGIAEAHAVGIIHRDLKPANLFLTRRTDGSPLVKVLDFGLAKGPARNDETRLTTAATVLGTRQFMSPEQLRGSEQVDARSDIWSLGVCLYRLLTGGLPFEAPRTPRARIIQGELALATARAILFMAPRPPHTIAPGVPPGLSRVVLRCLEKETARRFVDVAELAAALEPYASPEVAGVARRLENVLAEKTEVAGAPVFARRRGDANLSLSYTETRAKPSPRVASPARRTTLLVFGFAVLMAILTVTEASLLWRLFSDDDRPSAGERIDAP